MSRPVLLDLFSGAGGATRGYQQAGFEVWGVDIEPQPRYVGERFIQADALAVLRGEILDLAPFAAIHASPTCQTRSRATAWRGRREDHPDLLTPTLAALERLSVPWVVENVPEASWDGTMRADHLLCGTQFGLAVRRHRVFQCGNWNAFTLMPRCTCYRNPRLLPFMHKGERAFADAMGCDWMTNREARQAIPPLYTHHVGEQLLDHLVAEAGPGPVPAKTSITVPARTAALVEAASMRRNAGTPARAGDLRGDLARAGTQTPAVVVGSGGGGT